MDRRLIYFAAGLLVLAVGALILAVQWAASYQGQPAPTVVVPILSPTMVQFNLSLPAAGEVPTATHTAQPGPAATAVVAEPTAVPTLLPTIAPPAAATALSLYQPQLAEQGGDPNFRLIIPAIGVDTGIATLGWHTESRNGELAAVWDDPKYAVGYVVSSALPGAPGNTVMIGHNNIFGGVFRKLSSLKAGATIDILFQGSHLAFVVAEVQIIKERGVTPEQQVANLRFFDPTSDTRLTLLSCWPETTNTHRVVVIAKP